MKNSLQIGQYYKLVKPTFLYQGILILQNSKVELIKIHSDDSLTVLYLDKENNPHQISKFQISDLKEIS